MDRRLLLMSGFRPEKRILNHSGSIGTRHLLPSHKSFKMRSLIVGGCLVTMANLKQVLDMGMKRQEHLRLPHWIDPSYLPFYLSGWLGWEFYSIVKSLVLPMSTPGMISRYRITCYFRYHCWCFFRIWHQASSKTSATKKALCCNRVILIIPDANDD